MQNPIVHALMLQLQEISHCDIKLESTLGIQHLWMKIYDFGYSKGANSYMSWIARIALSLMWFQSAVLHSKPKSRVGTPAYIAPEVFREKNSKVSSTLCNMHLLTLNFHQPLYPRREQGNECVVIMYHLVPRDVTNFFMVFRIELKELFNFTLLNSDMVI